MNKKIINQIEKDLLNRKKQIEKNLKSFTKQDIHEKDAYHAEFPNYGDEND